MTRWLTALALTATLFLPVASSDGAVQGAATDGSIAIHPADQSKPWLIYNTPRGATSRGQFVVSNPTSTTVPIKLYAVDADLQKSSGAFVLKPRDAVRQDVGAWLKLPTSSIVLKPHAQRLLDFELTVPRGIRPGRHTGGIVAEGPPTPSRAGAKGEQVLIVERLGLRAYVNVPANVTAQLAISNLNPMDAKWTTGKPLKWLGIEHGRSVTFSASIQNRKRGPARHLQAQLQLVRQGRTVTASPTLDVPNLAGKESRQIRLTARFSGWSTAGYEARILVRDGGDDLTIRQSLAASAWAISPFGALGLTIGVGLVLLVLARARARRRKRTKST